MGDQSQAFMLQAFALTEPAP
ncbi:MAG: hypothetical protein JWQ00_3183, partial [Noviherbaspirillum sp.]|nr:hypothetical protein [Noviherbaspirillum sp.]